MKATRVIAGHGEPQPGPLDAVPFVMEALVSCLMADGSIRRFVLTGPMPGYLEVDAEHRGPMSYRFRFEAPIDISEVTFPGA